MKSSNFFYVLNIVKSCNPMLFLFAVINIFTKSMDAVLSVFVIRYCLNCIEKRVEIHELVTVLLFITIYIVLSNIYMAWYQNIYVSKVSLNISEYMSKKIFEKASCVMLKNYDEPEFYDLFVRAAGQADTRCMDMISDCIQLAQNFVAMIFMFYIVVVLDKNTILITTVLTIISICFSVLANKPRFEREQELLKEYRKKSYVKRIFFLNDFTKELRTFGLSSLLLNQHHKATVSSLEIVKKYGRKLTILTSLYSNISAFTQPVIIIYLYIRTFAKKILVGDFVSILTATQQYQAMLGGILGFIPKFREHNLYLNQYRKFLKTEDEEHKMVNVRKQAFKELKLENVSFAYPKGDTLALSNISFRVRNGEKIMIMGGNGAGKSSLIRLLLGFYLAQEGGLYINGIIYNEKKTYSFRQYFSVVFQDYQIYSLSVAENILMHRVRNDKDIQLVNDVLKKCKLWDKIMGLEDGIDTVLTKEFDEKGEILSGGERQKIALARMLANAKQKSAEIIVLDEPTSALDSISEKEIYEMLFEEFEKKTMIIISHRKIFEDKIDKCYWLEHGKLREVTKY